MNLGFNSKAQLGQDSYDVQTEDHSASHLIDTLVLNRGRVVYRHSTSYEDLAAAGLTDQAILRARVEKQHRDILDALREGVLSLEKPAPPKDGEIAVKLLNARSWLDGGRVWLDIAVLSKERNKGVGTRVIRTLQEEAAARSRPMVLSVLTLNVRALGLYVRLGFRAISETDTHTVMEWRR